MKRVPHLIAALAAAYGIHSLHYVWLLQRTAQACTQATSSHADTQELAGAQRICSAAGVDTTAMLRRIFPPASKS